jgi:hypothetical protein
MELSSIVFKFSNAGHSRRGKPFQSSLRAPRLSLRALRDSLFVHPIHPDAEDLHEVHEKTRQ